MPTQEHSIPETLLDSHHAPKLAEICEKDFHHQWIGLKIGLKEILQETIDFPNKYGVFL